MPPILPSDSICLHIKFLWAVRTCCDTPIILGGSAFSLFPEEISAYLGSDGGVKGEGEKVAEHFNNIIKGQIVAEELLRILGSGTSLL